VCADGFVFTLIYTMAVRFMKDNFERSCLEFGMHIFTTFRSSIETEFSASDSRSCVRALSKVWQFCKSTMDRWGYRNSSDLTFPQYSVTKMKDLVSLARIVPDANTKFALSRCGLSDTAMEERLSEAGSCFVSEHAEIVSRRRDIPNQNANLCVHSFIFNLLSIFF
jgi:hypothetical protein